MNRELIIKESVKVIKKYGYRKTKISWIADNLSASHATIYKYFKDKNNLFKSIVIDKMILDERSLKSIAHQEDKDCEAKIYKYLWMLSRMQREYFMYDREIFNLMRHFYDNDSEFRSRQNRVWQENLAHILKDSSTNLSSDLVAKSILNAFCIFFVPYFCYQWKTDYYQVSFDTMFNLLVQNGDQSVDVKKNVI